MNPVKTNLPPPRAPQTSNPASAALSDTVRRMRTVQLPAMRDKRSVTRRILDALGVDLAPPPSSASSLSDSRG